MFSSCRHRDSVYSSHELTPAAAAVKHEPIVSADQLFSVSNQQSELDQHPWDLHQLQRQQKTMTYVYDSHQSLPCHHHHHRQQQQHPIDVMFDARIDYSTATASGIDSAVHHGHAMTNNGCLYTSSGSQYCHTRLDASPYCDYGQLAMMTSHRGMTSSQYHVTASDSWRQQSPPSDLADSSTIFDLPAGNTFTSTTAVDRFRSRDRLTDKIASFGRRVREAEVVGRAELVSATCSAYERWTAAIETERRCRVRIDHSGTVAAQFDAVLVRLIDVLEGALRQPPGAATDLATALFLSPAHSGSLTCVVDVETLLERVSVSGCDHVDQLIAARLRTVSADGDVFDDDLSPTSSVCFFDATQSSELARVAATSTSSPVTATHRRRSRQPHGKAAVSLLTAWYDEHRSRPYADDAEVRRLAMLCQLRVRQVQKWLSNRRRADGNTRRRYRPAHNAKSPANLSPTML